MDVDKRVIQTINSEISQAKQERHTGKITIEINLHQGQIQRKIKCAKSKTITV